MFLRKIKFSIIAILMILSSMLIINLNCINVEAKSDVQLNDLKIVDIAAGTDHNLDLDEDGNLWAWGRNDFGQIGNGTTIDQPTPVQIMRGHKFKKISAGNGFSAAIDVDGYLYGWGNECNPCLSSKLIPTLVSDSKLYKDVHCSYDSTQLVDKTSDRKYFGYTHFFDWKYKAGKYYQVTTKQCKFDYHTVLLSYNSYRAFTFKPNYSSGDNFAYLQEYSTSENIMSADGLYYLVRPASGYRYHSFAQYEFFVLESGKLIYNNMESNFRTYDYPETSRHLFFPELELSSLENEFLINVSVRKVFDSSSTGNSSAYFLNDKGKIYSVGYNGQNNFLGNQNYIGTEMVTIPVEVQSEAKFTKVSAGKNHVLALDENGKVYSWGNNAYGQLGHDDTTIRTIPTMIKTFDESKSFAFNAFSNEMFNDTFYQTGGTDFTLIQDGSKGFVDINSTTGDFSYTPNTNEYGNDTAVISISYSGVVVTYQVNVFIDRKPVFTGGIPLFNVECGQSFTGNAPSTDPDNHSLTYMIVKHPLKGTVILNNNAGSYTYTAGTDLAGSDSFVIGVSDGYCTVEYPVDVHIQSLITYDDATTINIDLLQENQYSGNIKAKDIDGDTLSYSISKLPVKGQISIDSNGNYSYIADGDKYGVDTFIVKIDDGYKPLEVEYTVNLYAVSDNGTSLLNKITKGTTYTDSIKTNANGVLPIYSIKTQPKNGNVTINSNTGQYIYVPNFGSVGDDSFEVLVDYTYGQYVLTIHIYQNSIPNGDETLLDITAQENVNYTGTVVCEDVDGDILNYSLKTKPLKGSVLVNPNTGEYTYYPNKDVAGNDSFEVLVQDGTDSITITISVHIESEIEVNSTINEIISQNTSLSSQIVASDKDGDILTYSIKNAATNGISNVDSITGEYVYIPFNNYYGNDSFVVEVTDGVVAKLVTINVTVNRRPITNQVQISLETSHLTVTGVATCEDPDGDTLIYTIETQPSMGNVIINSSNGAFAYTPNLEAAGNDTFTIKASDGCDYIIVTICVHNETEVLIDDTNSNVVVNQGKSTTGQVNAIDLDGDALTYNIEVFPKQGTLNLNISTGAWTYNATKNASGTDTFTVSVSDGNVSKSMSYYLTVNTPAEFTDDIVTKITTNENTNYSGSVYAFDNDGDSLVYKVVLQGTKGTVSIDSTSGRYLYSPKSGETGDDLFIIGVDDGNFVTEISIYIHIESDIVLEESTLTVTVNKGEITTGEIKAVDNDGDKLDYAINQQGTKGNANIANDGSWSYFANVGAGNDSFVVSITDGIHTKYVTIYVHIYTKPIFQENYITISVSEGSSTEGAVHGSDEDGDSLLYSLESQPQNGTLNLNSQTGEFTYTVFSNNTAKNDVFTLLVSDGQYSAVVEVNVLINNSPEVSDININVHQGGNYEGKITAVDPENDKLVFNIGIQGTKGKATINSETGDFTYVLTQIDNVGSDTFTINVSDGYNEKEIVVYVKIEKNSKPIADVLNLSLNSDSTVSGTIKGTDIDGDKIRYSISSQGVKGNAVINEQTGEVIYTSYKDTKGYDCFVVTLNDGYNEVSYLVQVNIEFVDSNNSWAIPTTIITSSIAILSMAAFLFLLFKKKK